MNNFVDFHSGTNQEPQTEEEGKRLRLRTTILCLLFSCFLMAFFGILYNLQITHGAEYRKNANTNVAQSETVESVRGEILDRYGRVLVTNEASYNVELNTTTMGEDQNNILQQLVALCAEQGVEWTDTLPISTSAPWEYTKDSVFTYTSTQEDGSTKTLSTYLGKLAEKEKWVISATAATLTPQQLMERMCETFDIPLENGEITPEIRQLLGVRYELALRKWEITYNTYVFAENVDISFITLVKERALKGVSIVSATSRQYNTTYAAHVLGRVADISSTQWPTYQELGYPMDAKVGQDGVELAFESYLHGTSGTRLIETDENGKIISSQWKTEPEPGDNVVLTLDSALQATTEDALAEFVQNLDNPAGAAAVMVDMTGGVLSMASYPTFNLSTYGEDYNDLLANENNPLVNRATMGLYAPGSTFKPLTAIAALSEGIISSRDTVYCTGVYTYYPDTRPRCWIYPGSHGSENVSEAITDSCNVFFYDVGRRLGIDKLVEYAQKFGLGSKTGLELPELNGVIAGPETTESYGGIWYGGEIMYASIGQENHQFTPIQLANYIATLVNGGNRYQTHLLKEVKSSDYSQVVYQYEPVVMDTVAIDPNDLEAVKKGMYDLSQTATMARYFADLPVTVGCKTGTAEVYGKDATSLFVAFAPYDNPQVALCLVAEEGEESNTSLASIAAQMLRQYFSTDSSLSGAVGENTLRH